jgi:hypothetical protein
VARQGAGSLQAVPNLVRNEQLFQKLSATVSKVSCVRLLPVLVQSEN